METNTFAPTTGGQIFYRLEGDAALPVLLFSNFLGTVHASGTGSCPSFEAVSHFAL